MCSNVSRTRAGWRGWEHGAELAGPVREIFPVLPGARPMREHAATTTLRSTKLT
jgi:hypothetical protein